MPLRQGRHNGGKGKAGWGWFQTPREGQLSDDSESTVCTWCLGLKLRTEIWVQISKFRAKTPSVKRAPSEGKEPPHCAEGKDGLARGQTFQREQSTLRAQNRQGENEGQTLERRPTCGVRNG